MGIVASVRTFVLGAGTAFADCFLPQCCAICRTRIESGRSLCPRCRALLKPDRVLFCPICRFTRARRVTGAQCAVHGFVRGAAAFHSGEHILSLIHRLKYSGERHLAALMADLILESGIIDADLRDFQFMCPVPLSPARQRERGFNQSAEIARRLETSTGVPLIENLLLKRRPTREQAKLGSEERRKNVPGSFALRMPGLVVGRNVILIDDVVTTGSTVAACIETLSSAGAGRVAVMAVSA